MVSKYRKITRNTHRSIPISLNSGQRGEMLHILNTYAPHMAYNKEIGGGWGNIGRRPKVSCAELQKKIG